MKIHAGSGVRGASRALGHHELTPMLPCAVPPLVTDTMASRPNKRRDMDVMKL